MSRTSLPRLSTASLARLRSHAAPPYDRTQPAPIVHLGLGAFARAHLGVYADELLRLGRPTMIRAISLRSSTAADQLVPQDCLYTVSDREPGRSLAPRVIGSVATAHTGPRAAIASIADPTTTLVTLTITEKGYDGAQHDIDGLTKNLPHSAMGVIAFGLDQRRRAGLPAPVIASLDNLLDNGEVLRRRLLDLARQRDPSLADWIDSQVSFPTSVVDRMVPATTEVDLDAIAHQIGLRDLGAVTAERHRSWVIENVPGLPPLADVGVDVVSDINAYQRRKLWLLNGPHSALAYCGLLVGAPTIAAAASDSRVTGLVASLVDDILAVANLPPQLAPIEFAADAMHRFGNPELGHTCVQVAADGSRKLAQRLLPVAALRQERGLDTSRFALVVAVWIAAVSGLTIAGATLPAPEDPLRDQLRRVSAGGDLNELTDTAVGSLVDAAFAGQVRAALADIVTAGPMVLTPRL